MITRVDSLLVEESRKFRLCFTCDVCVHFDPDHAVCSHGYPTAPHRKVELSEGAELLFCKEFELA